MKHIIELIDEPVYKSPLLDFYFAGKKLGSLDIESTGLSATRNKFILGGLYNFSTQEFHQFLATSREEEVEALDAYLEEISKLDVIITYNGKHFDMPFIQTRYKHLHGHEYEGTLPFNLDIYLLLNGHSPVKHFVPNLKQKTVENYLGLWDRRSDEISGAESVDMYNVYEKTGDLELERQILLHNSDDVMQLARLLKIIAKCDIHKGMQKCGFPAGDLTVNKVHLKKDKLLICGMQRGCPLEYMAFEMNEYPAFISFKKKSRSFEIEVPIIREHGIAIIDLLAAGTPALEFERFPSYSSGYLVVESNQSPNYMELNQFVKTFVELVLQFIERN